MGLHKKIITYIRDLLTHYFSLKINSLYAGEYFFQRMAFNHIKLEIFQQLSASLNLFGGEMELFVSGEDGEQSH